MKFRLLSSVVIGLTLFTGIKCAEAQSKARKSEKTTFQTADAWNNLTDVRSDVAIVYGANDRSNMTFKQRLQSWRDKGYVTHFMTGIAWGNYEDYFSGKWDGKDHLDEGQVVQGGDTLWHGRMVPYLVPSDNFIKYLCEMHIKKVIDEGVDAIYLEEPEFWMRAGYSEAFKREWQKYYGFAWRAQHESPENTYLSNKLKYQLYYNALNKVFSYAKEYGKSKGMDVRCYVPTHSLVNYSSWEIVSPEASLASLPCVDGYIAQVWTGTSRTPTYFNGLKKERVFENAFLEYGSMESMTAPTGRKMFFLTDPIEDWPRDWNDYKINYQATFTAQLLYPMIANYEVMPWPSRIYEGLYKNLTTGERERIPRHYSAQMQIMVNSLNEMPLSENRISGSNGVSVLMSNSLMFQRTPSHNGYEDPQFSNFYGQTFPLLKRGIPVKTLHIENVGYPETWKETKVLVMSYSNMKPLDPVAHQHIAEWVKKGGVLLFVGGDQDPYQSVLEWWNSNGNNYKSPSEHLFEMMLIDKDAKEGEYRYGKGTVSVIRQEPKEFVLHSGGDEKYVATVKDLYQQKAKAGELVIKNSLCLSRGPYEIIAVLDESVNSEPYTIKGKLIDLFDPMLSVLSEKRVMPGEQAYLYNIDKVQNKKRAQVLAATSRIYDETLSGSSYSFVTKSPANTDGVLRILLPKTPKKSIVSDSLGQPIVSVKTAWDQTSKTYWLGNFENSPEGIHVSIEW